MKRALIVAFAIFLLAATIVSFRFSNRESSSPPPSPSPTAPVVQKYIPSASQSMRSSAASSPASPEDRAKATRLLSAADLESRKQLLDFHRSTQRDLRRLIEERAAPDLKLALAAQSAEGLVSKSAAEQVAAFDTLHHLASSDGKAAALACLKSNSTPEVAAAAIAYLGRINAHEAFDAVHKLGMESTNEGAKATALRNLVLVGGVSHPAEVMEVLEPALSDPSPRIQAEALRTMGRFPDKISPAARARIEELSKTPQVGAVNLGDSARMLLAQLDALKKINLGSKPQHEAQQREGL